jgi:uncharacterized protein (DUF486 family)
MPPPSQQTRHTSETPAVTGMSAAHSQLQSIVKFYHSIAPTWAFPLLPFVIASIFQVFAWFGGRFLGSLTLVPRVFVLWLFALGEYAIMSPAMNAAQEILGMQENTLIVLYNVATLVVFGLIAAVIFKSKFTWRHILALVLVGVATYLVYI